MEPKYLYKYMDSRLKRIQPILLKNTIYFSRPDIFNDPFDCATTIKFPDLDNLSPEDEADLKKYYHYLTEEDYERMGKKPTNKELAARVTYNIFQGIIRRRKT
jgi:hypothetical protein